MLPVPVVAMPISALLLLQLIVALPTLLVNGILTASPGQNSLFVTAVTTGSGFTVIVNTIAGPAQVFFVPVTLIVPTIGVPVVFTAAVNAAMLPAPLATRLIKGFVLVQLKVTPPETILEENGIAAMLAPEHTTTLVTAATTGVGLIVMVKVFMLTPALVQLLAMADTVIVPTISAPVLLTGAVPVILPLPEAARPIEVFEFAQLMVAPTTLVVNGMLMASPGQKVLSVTVATTG